MTPSRVRAACCALFACSTAATAGPYVLSTAAGQPLSVAGVSIWNGGAAPGFNFPKDTPTQFFGTSWDTSGGYSSITNTSLFGSWGIDVGGSTRGKVGFDVGVKATSGELSSYLPVTASFTLPDVVRPGETISIPTTLNTSGFGFNTTSPNFGFKVGVDLQMYAEARAQLCIGGCFGLQPTTLADIKFKQELLSFNWDSPSSVKVFGSESMPSIPGVSIGGFNGNFKDFLQGNLGKEIPLYTNKVSGENVVSLVYGESGGPLFPLITTSATNSGAAGPLAASDSFNVLSAKVDVGQFASVVSGNAIPPLAGSLKGLFETLDIYDSLAGSTKQVVDKINYNLITAKVGVAGLVRQDFRMQQPQVDIKLTLDQTGQVFTIAAGQTGSITIPQSVLFDQGGISFTPSLSVRPVGFTSQTSIGFDPLVEVSALGLGLGAVQLGPVFEWSHQFATPRLPVFTSTFDLNFGGFTGAEPIVLGVNREPLPITLSALSELEYLNKQITLQPGSVMLTLTTALRQSTVSGGSLTLGIPGSQLVMFSKSGLYSDFHMVGGTRLVSGGGSIGSAAGPTLVGHVDGFIDAIGLNMSNARLSGSGRIQARRLDLSDVHALSPTIEVVAGGSVTINNRPDAVARFGEFDNKGGVISHTGGTIRPGEVVQTDAGLWREGSTLRLERSAIQGGTVKLLLGGVVELARGGSLFGVKLESAGVLRTAGNNSSADIVSITSSQLRFAPGQSFTPVEVSNGTLQLAASSLVFDPAAGRVLVSRDATLLLSGASLTFGGSAAARHTDAGWVQNEGKLMAFGPGNSITSQGPYAIANGETGLVQVISGSQLDVTGALLNRGRVLIESGATLSLRANDTWSGGVVQYAGSLDIFGGTLNLIDGASKPSALVILGGDVRLGGDGVSPSRGGSIVGDVLNEAGVLHAGAGTRIVGEYRQGKGGTLELDEVGAGELFAIEGDAYLDGILDLTGFLPSGFTPIDGYAFMAFEYSRRFGEFSSFELAEFQDFLWIATYKDTTLEFSLRAVQGLVADVADVPDGVAPTLLAGGTRIVVPGSCLPACVLPNLVVPAPGTGSLIVLGTLLLRACSARRPRRHEAAVRPAH